MNNKSGAVIIEGHVQGLSNTRSLGEAGIPVYVVDKTDCIAAKSIYCKKFFLCPDFQTDDFADFLIKLAKEEKLNGWVLIPSNDHAVYSIAKHMKILKEYYKVTTPELTIIDNIYDKVRLLDVAQQHNIPIPRTQVFQTTNDQIADNLQFPVITKGCRGLSFYKALRQKAFLANDEMELRRQLNFIAENHDIANSFTQELIPFDGHNKTVSFTTFCEAGEIKTFWMGVKLREHPLRFGTATFAKSVYVEECYEQSVLLLKALNYSGVCEVEYLFDPRDKKYKLIEINARTWLWVGLAKACGVDYAKLIYDYVNGNSIVWPQSYKQDIYWMNPFSDFVYSLFAIIQGKLSLSDYIAPLRNKNIVNALFIASDKKPGIMYLLNVFSFLKQR